MITILTPTYNRKHTLPRLYYSLQQQTSFEFEWLVIDDGSTDGTEVLIKEYINQNNSFTIRYYKKNNGGKHRAMNFGIKNASGTHILFLDSDDKLAENCVEEVLRNLENIRSKEDFCGITINKCSFDGQPVGNYINYDVLDCNFIEYRMTYGYIGDRAEIIKTSILKEYPFPEYPNEKFITEAIVWNRIAKLYKSRYLNKNLYLCEYQEGGLSDTSTNLFTNNPKGSMLFYKEQIQLEPSILKRILYISMYWRFRFSTNIRNNPELWPCPIYYLILPIYPLYMIGRKYFK